MEKIEETEEGRKYIEYKKALLVVDRYHKYLLEKGMGLVNKKTKTKIYSFIQYVEDKDTRLYGVLMSQYNKDDEIYLEDLNRSDMLRCRNMGDKTLSKFLELREEYIKENE